MATVRAYKAINMVSPTITYGELVSYDASHIRLSNGADTGIYYGSFTYSASGLSGGTVTGYDGYDNGVLAVTFRDGSVNALSLNAYLDDGNALGAFALALRGNDSIYGSVVSDQLRGFGGNDTINGGGGSDIIYGDAGRDVLNGGAGTDRLFGGRGDDVLIWSGAADTYNGGDGTDALRINSGNVDLTLVNNNKLVSIEQIDLRSGNHVLTLNQSDVLDMSPTDTVKILGDASDSVDIDGSFTAGAESGGFRTYFLGGGAKLVVDVDIDVI